MAENKIKFGISKAYYAVGTEGENNTMTYGTPKPLPGAVSLSMDQNGGSTTFYADNVAYWVGNANNGYTGSLELARIPDEFLKDILGDIEDGSKVLVEDATAKAKYFALLFQFEGDDHATRHCFYKCSATRPAVSGTTKEDTIEPQTETIDITCIPVHNATLDKDIVKAKTNTETTTEAYNGWFTAVYLPTAN